MRVCTIQKGQTTWQESWGPFCGGVPATPSFLLWWLSLSTPWGSLPRGLLQPLKPALIRYLWDRLDVAWELTLPRSNPPPMTGDKKNCVLYSEFPPLNWHESPIDHSSNWVDTMVFIGCPFSIVTSSHFPTSNSFPFPINSHAHTCSVKSNSLWPHGLQPARILCPLDFPGKNTGAGCHFFLQGIFPTQWLNPCLLCLLHWRADSLPFIPFQ